jgi:hypothetical protein
MEPQILLVVVSAAQAGAIKHEEFDPGSGRTLAACLMHASRTGLFGGQWRTAEEHVGDLPLGGGQQVETPANPAYARAFGREESASARGGKSLRPIRLLVW